MAVIAPPPDTAGAALDTQIATVQALATANRNPLVEAQLQQQLNTLQVQAVDHYMVTGWLNAATILAMFSAPTWDKAGVSLAGRIAFLQNLVNNPPTMPPGNADGYGDSGWTTIAAAQLQMLYAKQIELVEHLMALSGGTTAATILSTLTGTQTDPAGIPYQYVFNSVGFTDEWIDD